MRAPRNPDLPIVDELRAELGARIIAEESSRERVEPGIRPRRRLPERGRQRRRSGFARRVTRRSTVIVALLFLVGGVALAQLDRRGGGPPRSTEPQELGASADWTISGYRDEARLCVLFSAGRVEMATDCGPVPGPAGLRATSLRAGGRRFVVGLAGARVRSAAVRVGRHRQDAPTRLPTNPAEALRASVPAGVRWFVIPGLGHSTAAAHVIGLDRSGDPLGPELLDCSLRLVDETCERAYEEKAIEGVR